MEINIMKINNIERIYKNKKHIYLNTFILNTFIFNTFILNTV